MRVLPILFNTDMVQAILDGRKTVTRRVMKPQPLYYTGRRYIFADECCPKKWEDCDNIIETYQYQPRDILYIRETWAFMPCIDCDGDYIREGGLSPCYDFQAVEYDDGDSISEGCFLYRADCRIPERITWRPSIHMPKVAARIWLKVTDVRVERLQDMNGQDILREGVNCHVHPEADYFDGNQKMMFEELWNSTLKKDDLENYGWDANPWVWVIEFERCAKPTTSVN